MGKRDLLNRPFQSNGCQNKILRELSDLLAVNQKTSNHKNLRTNEYTLYHYHSN